MTRVARRVAFVGFALLAAGPLAGQPAEPSEKEKLAESLVQRAEAAVQRALDPKFRAAVVRALAALGDEDLEARAAAGPGLGPLDLGDPGTQLVYTKVAPCRLIDTRAGGGSLAPGAPRDFRVTGAGLQGQGGEIAGCGVPFGTATAAAINFVAVNAVGPGNLRAWAYDTPPPLPPNASILNYQTVPGLNIANEVIVPLCTGAPANCPFDIRVQADGSGTQLVADVLGYFERFPTEDVRSFSVLGSGSPSADIIALGCANVASAQVAVAAPGPGTVVVRANVRVGLGHVSPAPDTMMLVIQSSPTSCPPSSISRVALPAGAADGTYVYTVPVAATFAIPATGTFTYYVNALMEAGSGVGNDSAIVPLIEATFHPN